ALGDRIVDGVVAVKDGHLAPTRRVRLLESGHPVPDARGAAPARAIHDLARTARPDDLLLVLISGGGSALTPPPAPPTTLYAKPRLTRPPPRARPPPPRPPRQPLGRRTRRSPAPFSGRAPPSISSTRCGSTARYSRAASSPGPPAGRRCTRSPCPTPSAILWTSSPPGPPRPTNLPMPTPSASWSGSASATRSRRASGSAET